MCCDGYRGQGVVIGYRGQGVVIVYRGQGVVMVTGVRVL